MIKYVYLLWPREAMAPSRRHTVLLGDCASQLCRLAAGVQMNIADHCADVPSPAPRPLFSEPFVAQVNLWMDEEAERAACENILQQAGFIIAGYQVDERLYTEYGDNEYASPRDWADGERSPGIVAVTLLRRPKRIPRKKWMLRWFGTLSPVTEWMQPRARYMRNVVQMPITTDAAACDGIVEENWPSAEHVTNRYLFYGAHSRLQLLYHMAIMLKTVASVLNLWNITTVMTSEYFVKTPPGARR